MGAGLSFVRVRLRACWAADIYGTYRPAAGSGADLRCACGSLLSSVCSYWLADLADLVCYAPHPCLVCDTANIEKAAAEDKGKC